MLDVATNRFSASIGKLVEDLHLGAPDRPVAFAPSSRRPTGFDVLDMVLTGGLAATELALVAGRPGVGKTIAALQWARHAAGQGCDVVYVCYEHKPQSLLARLLAQEIRVLEASTGVTVERADLSGLIGAEGVDPTSDMIRDPVVRAAAASLQDLGDRLCLVDGTSEITPWAIDQVVSQRSGPGGLLVVDYLQRVPLSDHDGPESHAGVVAQQLKEIAKTQRVSVVAISSLDEAGLRASRARARHLDGSALISYEADLVVMLNSKAEIVSQSHVADDVRRLDDFRRRVVFSIEKNRSGEADVDLEFERDFAWFRFDPRGVFTQERLVEEVHHRL